MATKTNVAQAGANSQSSQTMAAYLMFAAGWLVPGAGHLLQRRWIRGILLFFSITIMFAMGLGMQGKIYAPNSGEILDMLGFLGDLGNGALYLISAMAGWGQNVVQVVTADYGTKFMVVAGLLNFIAAVDAHSIRLGRKP
ncbi:MAG TPA: DUF6677 family protein [Acidobacteriaceae bacterium]|jgi:hypothetical protein|nr:DUF6677 family protein [Acidobacteriaceae bacterium]